MKLKTILILIFLPTIIVAQNLSLKGNVVEAKSNEPLPGATLLIKGTLNGTTSDFDGNFEINTKIGDTLVVSFLGMITQEVLVFSSPITIKLEDDIDQLDEVLVSVGYFDVSKKDLSGSITQIKAEQLEQNRGSSLENLLQGQVAGVVVTESAEPGGGVGISIRGTNSILGGTQPLYVLDGIPISPISDAQGNGNSGGAQSSMSFIPIWMMWRLCCSLSSVLAPHAIQSLCTSSRPRCALAFMLSYDMLMSCDMEPKRLTTHIHTHQHM